MYMRVLGADTTAENLMLSSEVSFKRTSSAGLSRDTQDMTCYILHFLHWPPGVFISNGQIITEVSTQINTDRVKEKCTEMLIIV